MSKERKAKFNGGAVMAPARKKFPMALASLLVLTALGVGWGVWLLRPPSGATPNGGQSAEASASDSNTLASTPNSEPRFQTLVGRWVRPDGGYVLEIKSAPDSGALEAAYYNPNPIHVARAEASREGSTLQVFIELRDVNYPGSSYTLRHDAGSDQLQGIYYQAMENERYNIFFQRLK
ncbi:MAG: hypothetical protein AB9869_09200 [Verrucomicrobiia bacterium]